MADTGAITIATTISSIIIFRLINPRIWFPFAIAIPHCYNAFISPLIVYPKSFSFTVVCSTVSPIVYCASSFPCPVSANVNTMLAISSSKSLIYIKNKICPNTDPCGTPLKTDFQFETSPQLLLFVFYQ